ncbi:MAG: RNA-directed DNA polymerase [Paludibacteraceae bacterium]
MKAISSPNPSNGNNVRNVNPSGALNNNNANNGNGCAPDYENCQIKVSHQAEISASHARSLDLSSDKEGTYIRDVSTSRGVDAIDSDFYSFKSLYHGLRKAQRNVIWKDSVSFYSLNNLKQTHRLRQSLLDNSYEISPYQIFTIHEPKEREIAATRIRDRQFQRSLCDSYLYRAVTKGFIRDNCACQRGKGVDDVLNRMDCHLHRFYRHHGTDGWILKCDIHHYFAETSHEVAKAAIRKRVDNDEAYRRVCDIIDSFGTDKGIGLGSQVSQLIELAVLDDLDHYIKEQLHIEHYLRYMDDFILIHESKDYLKQCLAQIKVKLASIGLELNDKTAFTKVSQGVRFLKWKFSVTPTGKVIRKLSKRSIVKERRKLKKLGNKVQEKKLHLSVLANSFNSWLANARRGNAEKEISQMRAIYLNTLRRCI